MLLDDAQIALNDVIVNCRDAADHYEDAAGMVEQAPTARLFHELARRRHAVADRLATHIRRLGGLPRNADGDRETVGRLLARLKASLSEDKQDALLTEREQVEAQLDAIIHTALEQDIPDDTQQALRKALSDVTAARQQLAKAKLNISGND